MFLLRLGPSVPLGAAVYEWSRHLPKSGGPQPAKPPGEDSQTFASRKDYCITGRANPISCAVGLR